MARLRSGHNRLNAHMHRKLKSFLPQRVLVVRRTRQPSMFFRDVTDTKPERVAQWQSATPLHQKLYGVLEDLKKATNFITAAGLVV